MMVTLKSRLLKLTDIDVRDRIREDLGEIEEFAEAIRDDGLLQPIVVEELPLETLPIEANRLQEASKIPIYRYKLIAGGRRYTAFTLLASNKVDNKGQDFSYIPAVLKGELSEHVRIKLELEENLRRKGMTWQENIVGIVKYHKACKRAAAADGESWSQSATGELLNMSQASVSVAFTVYDAIKNKDEKVLKAESLNDAIKAIASAELDTLQAEQMRRINERRSRESTSASLITNGTSTGVCLPTTKLFSNGSKTEGAGVLAGDGKTAASPQFTKDQIAAFYYHGDGIEVIPKIAAAGPINHFVFDPPYAIDMANFVTESIDRVAETHQVKPNLQLIEAFLDVGFKHIAQDGFMAMWYDLDHHEKIATWAEKIGWKVQAWPFIWCKTSPCRNSQAQYNFTKSTECCYLFRRSETSILKQKQSNNYILEPSASTPSHPFVKPERVWSRLIEAISLKGQTIIDPCAGEGSSLIASFKLGRTPVGVEIDEKHIASGINYIQEQLAKRDMLSDILSESIL